MGNMQEKAARAILRDRALSNGVSEGAIDYHFVTEGMRLDARAALSVCHFEELVEALKDVLDETVDESAVRRARALLAKVEDESHD